MNYTTLLDVATELGYQLAMSGAETFRIEESINRVMTAYGIHVDAFAIPNCLHITIEANDATPITRMRRIGYHGSDLDAVEKYSNLSRKICNERPAPDIAKQWLEDTKKSLRTHPFWVYLLGNFMGGCGFSVLFNGGLLDCLFAGLCGVIIGLVNTFMEKQKVNMFFKTIASSFVMAFVAYLTCYLNLNQNTEAIIIGALMILVPGLLFTNAMRDIIYGDTNSGINRIVQVFLIAAAIALGTGTAFAATNAIWSFKPSSTEISYNLLTTAIACLVGCIGFSILFNIHWPGQLLCAAGGVITWVVFSIVLKLTTNALIAYFIATVVASLYSEIMARVRKYPALSYLVISIFPLVPGAGVYNMMQHAASGNMGGFAKTGTQTIAIAGVMAVGILLVSTCVRMITLYAQNRIK